MKTKSEKFLLEEKKEWIKAGEGIQRQIMGYDERLMMVKVRFEKGAIAAIHSHPHSQATYVVSGKFETFVDGERCVLSAGDGFYSDPDMTHNAVCLEEGVLIDVFSPIREDFL